MLGYTVEEWMSEPRFWLKIIPEEERELALRRNDEIFASGTDGVVQHRWCTKDGRLLWVEAHLSVIVDENKNPIGLRGVTLDITERKDAEEGLRNALIQVEQLKDRLQQENVYLREHVDLKEEFEEIIGDSEEITISHRAFSRALFASGALVFARWLAQQKAGTYGLLDVKLDD